MDLPENLTIISSTYSSIHLKWIPPFTLEITDEDSTMTVYEVIVNGEVISETVMEPEYIYHRHDYVHCGRIVFQVAAINEVGRGNVSEGIEAGFLGRKPCS